MKITGLSTLLFLALAGLNCKKDSNSSTPTTNVAGAITITSPIAGTIFDNGFGLNVEGQMTDDNGLATAKVEIRNKTTGAVLFQQTSSTGNVSLYRFAWIWTVTGITSPITATVKVIAIDRQSNQVFKEVDVVLTN